LEKSNFKGQVRELQAFKRTVLEYFVAGEEDAILGFLEKLTKIRESTDLPDLDVMPTFIKSLAVEEFLSAVEFESHGMSESVLEASEVIEGCSLVTGALNLQENLKNLKDCISGNNSRIRKQSM
jgi:hypothetical protein